MAWLNDLVYGGLNQNLGYDPVDRLIGRRGSPMTVESGTNSPGTVNGQDYTAHAFDQMQGRDVTPSVVEDAIQSGTQSAGRGPGEFIFSSGENGVKVVLTPRGAVKTVITTGRF